VASVHQVCVCYSLASFVRPFVWVRVIGGAKWRGGGEGEGVGEDEGERRGSFLHVES
jgi:hypothetical protein